MGNASVFILQRLERICHVEQDVVGRLSPGREMDIRTASYHSLCVTMPPCIETLEARTLEALAGLSARDEGTSDP